MMIRTCCCEDSWLTDRVIAEYLEMPGLNLTVPQASRLWNVDPMTCEHVLDELTEAGFLCKSRNTYVRMDAGRRAA
jgi:hypothetical protein